MLLVQTLVNKVGAFTNAQPQASSFNAATPNATTSNGSFWSLPGRGSRLAFEYRMSIISCLILYLPTIKLLQNYMKHRKPLKMMAFTFVWNLVLALLSIAGAILMLADDWTMLTRFKYDEHSFQPATRAVVSIFCLTKVVEFGDTVILILKKRKLSFLHVYHHLTVAAYCYYSLYININFAHFFVFGNLCVHGAMYSYFAATCVLKSNRFLTACRPYVTLAQILQMVLGLAISAVAMYDQTMTPNLLHYYNAQISLFMYISYTYLFTTFYIENYFTRFRPHQSTYLLMFHFFAVVGVCKVFLHPNACRLFLEVILLYMIGGFGITCGAHRLWAHRSYKANLPFRIFMLLCNSLANQGTCYRWARDHRVHHKHSEQDGDPHDARRGFFFSHMGWLLLKKSETVKEAGKQLDCSDLLEDPVIRFQMNYDPFWNQFISFVLPSCYAYFVYNSYWLGFFTLGALRWVICLHATWTVNSVAHMWGNRPYDPNMWPAENWLTALVANGEGWHNWHHVYPFDYAASEYGIARQYNPSKVIIDVAAKLGMVWDRKRAVEIWEATKQRRVALAAGETLDHSVEYIDHRNDEEKYVVLANRSYRGFKKAGIDENVNSSNTNLTSEGENSSISGRETGDVQEDFSSDSERQSPSDCSSMKGGSDVTHCKLVSERADKIDFNNVQSTVLRARRAH